MVRATELSPFKISKKGMLGPQMFVASICYILYRLAAGTITVISKRRKQAKNEAFIRREIQNRKRQLGNFCG